jgi:hypothetical protein
MVYIPDCDCVVDGSPHAPHVEAAQRAHFLDDKKYVVKDICIGNWEQSETESISPVRLGLRIRINLIRIQIQLIKKEI